ncbi:hypothetical protein DL96DRAFT_1810664 [Flagelloscypha sp. PMI_526]|nr:hypothetical protein DL96DRAFT_1810664 [Flagelloscypha sp. PMI_526]
MWMTHTILMLGVVAFVRAAPTAQDAAIYTRGSETADAQAVGPLVNLYVDINYGDDPLGVGSSVVPTGCINLPSGWNDVVSSIVVTSGYQCAFWTDINCAGSTFTATGSVAYVGDAFNDKISSLQCSSS